MVVRWVCCYALLQQLMHEQIKCNLMALLKCSA